VIVKTIEQHQNDRRWSLHIITYRCLQKNLEKLFFSGSYFFTITNEYKTDLSRDKPSIDVLHVVRGGTFTFFSLSERKEKESKNFSFLKKRKVKTFLS
jgi:hypothetical protein